MRPLQGCHVNPVTAMAAYAERNAAPFATSHDADMFVPSSLHRAAPLVSMKALVVDVAQRRQHSFAVINSERRVVVL